MAIASDILIDAIHDWGVDVVFGLPGDGIMALWKRFGSARQNPIRPDPPWENGRLAVGMPYRQTRRLCCDTRTRRDSPAEWFGDAKLDGQPVLTITGLSITT